MTLKIITTIGLILLTLKGYSQDDYIVLVKGDTLTGKVKRRNLNSNFVKIKNDEGRSRIHLRKIQAWSNGNMPVTVVQKSTAKRTYWLELLLVIDGDKKLFRDLHQLWGKNIYYTEHEGSYIQLNQQNIEDHLRAELNRCKSFMEIYGQQDIKHWNLEQVFLFYNKKCNSITSE